MNASRSPEDAEPADALDLIGWPAAITVANVVAWTDQGGFREYLTDRKNSRRIPHRFEACGYTPVRHRPVAGQMLVGRSSMPAT